MSDDELPIQSTKDPNSLRQQRKNHLREVRNEKASKANNDDTDRIVTVKKDD